MNEASGLALFDTHCHLNFDAFDGEIEAVLERARAAEVTRVLIPATDLESSRSGAALAAKYPGVFAAAGLHPNSIGDEFQARLAELDALLDAGSFVAVGEIGLDYHWNVQPRDIQIAAFEAQLELAARHSLPVIIHNRDASDDVMAVLETWARGLTGELAARPGVLHSFSAPQAIAGRAIDAGFYLGFTGPLTFKNADDLRRIAAAIPLDRILVETDSPFLTPTPHRGQRNEPAYVRLIAERLALLRGLPLPELAAATTANALRLFEKIVTS